MQKKVFVIVLCLIFFIVLAGCTADIAPENNNPENEPEENNIIISADFPDREYYVIRSDYSPREETDAAVKLRKALEEYTGVKIGISTDWEKNPVYEYEFIIGETLREKDENVDIDRIVLGESGFIIRVVNNKVYISGGQLEGTALGVDYFIEKFITENNSGGKDVVIPKSFSFIQYHQYDIPELYIGGKLITKSHVIHCVNTKNMNLAEALRESVYYKTGLWMEIVTGTDLGGKSAAFVLSDIEPETKGIYQITVDGSSIVFSSSASRGLDTCVYSFIDFYITDVYGSYSFESDFTYVDLGDYIIVTMPEEMK